jgi:alpha-L-fucosidase 2
LNITIQNLHILLNLQIIQNAISFKKKSKAQMKNIFILNLLLFLPQFIFAQNAINQLNNNSFDPAATLWYSAPAQKWEEAIPVGNGRLGAMVFGKYKEERIQLNEETYWSGGPYSTVVKDGFKVLPDIQKKVFEGKYLEAHNLFGRNLMGYPVEQQKYQGLANLHLFFNNQDSVTAYKRWLDLNTGISSVSYNANGINFQRDVFASAPDQVIVVRITADKPGSISFKANLRGVRNQTHSNYATDYFRMDPYGNDGLILTGKSADYMGVEGKLKYEARIKAFADGGSVKTEGVDLIIDHANSVTLYFAAATNFINYKDVSGNQHKKVEDQLNFIKEKKYDEILSSAKTDYKKLYDRSSLHLQTNENSFLPTNERLLKIQSETDPSMAALSYNFGRYLMISSSRPGTQPANLQGIWNDDMNPSWDSKYTTNINTEMNYWPVESSNLSECAEPLITMVKELQDQGSQVARESYGARGWVLHQNTDIWRVAAPMDGPTWGTFTVGGAWLCTQLWEHYQYTMDKKYLQEIYPVIEGSVQFFMDFLVPHPNGKWLVTNPSTSPENFPDGGGNKPYFDEVTAGFREGTTICAGSSIDMQILYDLFGYFSEGSTVLGINNDFVNKVKESRNKLVPPQIGSDGSLQEWTEDWKSLEKNHRHFSHMYGLYPGKVLYEKRTPELIESYKKVLNERGDGATGFSRAWKMALWARLNDGERANKIYKGYLKDQSCKSLFALCGKAPQVDGTFGTTAAITEMLMQSHDGFIKLLPAVPEEWANGNFQGVCARGGFELNYKWDNKKISSLNILSKAGEICRIESKPGMKIKSDGKLIKYKILPNNITEFITVKGASYTIE